jgi:hypothetical protein
MVRLVIVLGMLVLPVLASGEELELELGSSVEYDSNVFRTSDNIRDDVVFRVYPAFALFRDRGDLRYRLRYMIPFEQGVNYGDAISDFDHLLNFNSSWAVDEANAVYLTNVFRYDRSITRGYSIDQSVPDLNDARYRVLTNRATLGMDHAFSARTTGGLSFSYDIFETEQRSRQDNQTFGATTDLNYALNAKNQVGTGFTFTLQDFEQQAGIQASQTLFYNLFGAWVYQFDETTTMSVQVGPTVVQTIQDSISAVQTTSLTPTDEFGNPFSFANCTALVNGRTVLAPTGGCQTLSPAFANPTAVTVGYAPEAPPPSGSDVTVTAFGNFDLERRWTPNVSSNLTYTRTQNNASGLGGSVILDAVSLIGDWQIDQWWDLSLRFDFTHRESIASQSQTFLIVQQGPNGEAQVVPLPGQGLTSTPVQNAINTNRWGVGARLGRQIGRRAEATLRLNYNQQSSEQGTRGNPSDFDDFLAILGVRYRFEPITLW